MLLSRDVTQGQTVPRTKEQYAPTDLAIMLRRNNRAADLVNGIVANAVDLSAIGQNGVSVVDPSRYFIGDRA
jgi:hypothetical protein